MPNRAVRAIAVLAAVAALAAAAWRLGRPATGVVRGGTFDDASAWTLAGGARIVRGDAADAAAAFVALPAVAGAAPAASVAQTDVRLAAATTWEISLRARGRGAATLEAWEERSPKNRARIGVWPAVPGRWTELRTQWTAGRDGGVTLRLVARPGELPGDGAVDVDDVAIRRVEVPDAFDVTGGAGFDDEPSVARAADGSFWVAWLRLGDDGGVRAARFVAEGPAFRRTGEWLVERGAPGSFEGPRVAASAAGTALVYAAERGDDWQIAVVPLSDAGPGARLDVGNAGATDCRPAAAWCGTDLWLAWESNAGGARRVWTSRVAGGAAEVPGALDPADAVARRPAIAATAAGKVAVAWHGFRDGNCDVWGAERGAAGFGPTRRLTAAPTIDRHASLAAHGEDVWLAWENATAELDRVGLSTSRRVLVARWDAEGLAAPPGDLAASPLGDRAELPALAIDAAGGLRVAFARARPSDRGWQAFVVASDAAGWAAPVPASPRRGSERGPSLVLDGDDAVLAIQADDLPGGWGDVDRTPDARSGVLLTRAARGGAAAGRAAGPPPVAFPMHEPREPFEAADLRRRFGDAAAAPRGTVVDGRPLRLLAGNLHDHSEVSVCDRLRDDTRAVSWENLSDFAPLDFGALTDHGDCFRAETWALSSREARLHDDPGRFVALLGEEWASTFEEPQPGRPYGWYGHRNVILADLRFPRWWNPRDRGTPAELWDGLRRAGADFVVIPHQLADTGNVPTDWTFTDDVAQPVAEVFQVRGSFEHRGAPRQAKRVTDAPGWFLADALAKGVVVGTIAAPDHGGGAARAFVWADTAALASPAAARAEILASLRARRCYGTTGARIVLDVRVNGRFMGAEDLAPPAEVRVAVRASCPGEVEAVEVSRDGDVRAIPFEASPAVAGGFDVRADWTDPAPPAGRTWTYVRIRQRDGEIAWSSPVWLGPRGKQ